MKSQIPFKIKREKLTEIYSRFEKDAYEYKKHAICKPGCAYCCSSPSDIDIVTLEGLIIHERVSSFQEPLRTRIKANISRNRRHKEMGKEFTVCPFLKPDKTCLIYDIRPFICRQLYSLEPCEGKGATIHRAVEKMASAAIRNIQKIDDTGYSGHISFILYLLGRPDFKKLYVSGGFDPGRIADFGETHDMMINRYAVEK